MLPFVLILTVVWTLFFVAWYLLGIPLGPGWPVRDVGHRSARARLCIRRR